MKRSTLFLTLLGIGVSTVASIIVFASDHDDGEIDLKGRSLNLTDLYVFKESDQTGNTADSGNIVLVMNSNPRSMPGQQYFFSTQARYEFHVSRVSGRDVAPSGSDDVILRATFGAPDANQRQPITITAIKDGASYVASRDSGGNALTTTSLADSAANTLKTFSFSLAGQNVAVFAGLRQDPFFFDVEGFFLARATLLSGQQPPMNGPNAFPRPVGTAHDFTLGYNVNSLVLRVTKNLLGGGDVYDVWQTISIPQ